jgi:hypothetical protein
MCEHVMVELLWCVIDFRTFVALSACIGTFEVYWLICGCKFLV